VLADRVDEHEIVVVGEALALFQPREAVGDVADHRHAADLLALRDLEPRIGVVPPDVDQAGDEVHVAPLEREQLALTEAGVGGGAVDRSVLRVPRVRGEQLDLVARVGVELAGVDDGRALDHLGRCGVVPDPTLALRALEDAIEHDQVSDDRAIAQRIVGVLYPRVGAVRGPLATPAGEQLLFVRVDVVGSDRIGRHVAELVEQVTVDHTDVALERGRVALADVAHEPEVLRGGVRERHAARPRRVLEGPAPGVGEDRVEDVACGSFGVAAGGAAAPPGVRGAEPPLHLLAGREPVPCVPLRPRLAVDEEDVPGDARHHGLPWVQRPLMPPTQRLADGGSGKESPGSATALSRALTAKPQDGRM
jgi:hypothetical protein